MEKKYIEKGRVFESVKIPLTLFQEGPLGIVPAYNGKNAEGNKGITYGPERIIEVHPFINAVDIDWNGAKVSSSGKTINTTAELFNWIGEKQAGKSAFLIAQQLDSSLENELQWLASLKGERGEKGEKGSKGDQGELGETPQLIFGQTITLEPGQDADVDISRTGNRYKLTFKIPLGKPGTPGRDGECQTEGGQSIGQVNKIESISIDGGESIEPDINKNVNINLQGYLAENLYIQQDTLEERLATKLDTLVSRENIRLIRYSDTPGQIGNYKYISLLPSDDGSTSISTDPNFTSKDTSTYSSGSTINMAKVAFSGRYNDLINRPDDDKYIKIFRKSLREEATTSYPDKDSIQRVVYKCVSQGLKSIIAGSKYGIENYTEEEILRHNSNLDGAFQAGTVLTQEEATTINNAINSSYLENETLSAIDANSYNATLEGHWDETTQKPGSSERTNIHDENAFVLNYVLGDHSVALGWGCLIGIVNDDTKGNHSFVEGKWTNVLGNFSHASGFQTLVNGDYSFSGGLNLNDGEVNSHYSFAYGKDLQTYNNGEVAFGEYNKSTTIERLRVPNLESEELAYDSLGNPWKVIDFYNIDLDQLPDYYLRFSSNIDLDFGDYLPGHESYNFGYVLSNTGYFEFIDKVFDFIINPQDGEYQNVNNFLIREIFDINWHKSIYTHLYELNDHGWPQHGVSSGAKCIIGVIAQRIDENGELIPILDNNENPIYIYEGTENLVQAYESLFFVWGPNTLYYKLDEPLTMLSIGNGNLNERSNLIEVTNDGNIHYANGEKNLFDLEDRIENINNTLDLTVENVSSENSSFDNTDIDHPILVFNINDLLPSRIIISDSDFQVDSVSEKSRDILLNISKGLYDYYKKVLILDISLFGNFNVNSPIIKLRSENCDIYLNKLVNEVDNFTISNDKDDITISNYDNRLLQITVEVFKTKCLVNIEEYNKVNLS